MNYLQKLIANAKRELIIWLLGQLGISRGMIDAEVQQREKEQRAREATNAAYDFLEERERLRAETTRTAIVSYATLQAQLIANGVYDDEPEPRQDYWRKTGYVYFIERIGQQQVKIGFSTRPTDRLKDLQTSSGDRLVILATIPGTYADERNLQGRFKQYRQSGEWFTLSQEISGFIAEVQANIDHPNHQNR